MQFVHPREPRLMELVLREIVRVLVYTKTIPPTKGSTIIKDQSNIHNGNAICKFKDELKEVEEINESIVAKVNGQGNVDIAVHS
uniref:Uncharacterized protein n=1 Tax=Fagus sylvatica TaxID=28930 RepID=A0A2N9F0X1_FAGSY